MLPKTNRLTSQEFDHLFQSGKRIRTKHFLLIVKKNQKEETPQWAVVVSKKKEKRAVARNQIKRFIYCALANVITTHSGFSGIVMYQGRKPDTAQDATNDISSTLSRQNN